MAAVGADGAHARLSCGGGVAKALRHLATVAGWRNGIVFVSGNDCWRAHR